MSYFRLYYHEKCISHNIKQFSVDLSDLGYSVSLLQGALDSVRCKGIFSLHMYEKYLFVQ